MGDQDDVLDARLDGLVDNVLDKRLVDDGEHLLGDCLGRGQHSGAESGHRYHRAGNLNFCWHLNLSEKSA